MGDENPGLIHKDYKQMEAILTALWKDGTERAGADPLTLAHALLTFSLERFLCFYDQPTTIKVCERQAELLSAMHEQLKASSTH